MSFPSSNITIDDIVLDQEALEDALRNSFARDPFDHYVDGICGLIICLIGCITNALSFSVLIRRTMRLSTYVYLTGLCLSDFSACFFFMPSYILNAYPLEKSDFELPRTYTYAKLVIITGAISTTARALSVWLCVAFTIDRWIMICRPFVGPLYCTTKNARRVTLIIYIISVFYAVPLMFEYEPHQDQTLFDILPRNADYKNMYKSRLTKLGSTAIFRWTYVLINALAVYIIPLIIIAILNRQLLKAIRLLQRRSAEYNTPFAAKQGVTVMLVATTIMLIVFRSPSTTVYLMWIIRAKMFINEKPPFPLRKFHSIANICAELNAATTFIIFVTCGPKFRSEFTRLYCGICTKFRKSKNKSTIKQDQNEQQQQQQQQTIQLLSDHQNDDNSSGRKSKRTSSSTTQTNGHFYIELLKDNNSAATSSTTTSNVPVSPMKRLMKHQRDRYSYDEEYDLMMKHNHNTRISFRQSQLPIREDECIDNHNDGKEASLTGSYFDCFKNLIGFR